MEENFRKSFLTVLLVGLLLAGCSVFSFLAHVNVGLAQTGEEAALAAVLSAGEELVSAYGAVLDAEKIGADVSPLLERLDLAGGVLAEANMSLRRGDFERAVSLADSLVVGLEGFESETVDLAASYQADWTQRFQLSLGVSVIGIFLVFVLGFFGWGIVKKRFVDRILGMKPEVA